MLHAKRFQSMFTASLVREMYLIRTSVSGNRTVGRCAALHCIFSSESLVHYCFCPLIVADPGIVSLWGQCPPPHYSATSWPNAEPPISVEHGGEPRSAVNMTYLEWFYICLHHCLGNTDPSLCSLFFLILFTWHSLLAQCQCHATLCKWTFIALILFKIISSRVRYNTLKWHMSFLTLSLQTDNAEQGVSHSQFMSLVQNLLRDPDERSNFFQVHFDSVTIFTQMIVIVQSDCWCFYFIGNSLFYKALLFILYLRIHGLYGHLRYLIFMNLLVFQEVFPGDFGPTYDKAIQTLMWLFLSRLEKLLPTQTLQQVDFFVLLHFDSLGSSLSK